MEILEAGLSGAEGAVFVVIIDGQRFEMPWVRRALLREGILVLEAASPGSGSAAATWVRSWDQAAWQVSLGEEASAAPGGRRVLESDPKAPS